MNEEINVKIRIEAFCHATEDLSKVLTALQNVAGVELKNYGYNKLLGHWKNPIIHVYYEFKNEEALNVLKNIISRIDEKYKKEISSKIELHLDEQGKLYLHLDKQEAYKGNLILSYKDDIIKVVIHAMGRKKENVIEIYKKLGILNE